MAVPTCVSEVLGGAIARHGAGVVFMLLDSVSRCHVAKIESTQDGVFVKAFYDKRSLTEISATGASFALSSIRAVATTTLGTSSTGTFATRTSAAGTSPRQSTGAGALCRVNGLDVIMGFARYKKWNGIRRGLGQMYVLQRVGPSAVQGAAPTKCCC